MQRPIIVCLALCLTAGCGDDSATAGKPAAQPAGETVAARPVPAANVPAGSLGGETSGGLAALIDVAARLQRAVTSYRAGQDPTMALGGIFFEATDAVRLELEHAGAVHITHLGLELELLFFSKGRGRYYVRTLVHAGSEGVSFLRVEGKVQADGKLGVRGAPFEAWVGAAEPFGTAGRALLERLRGPECTKLPLVDGARLRALIPNDDARWRLERDLDATRGTLAATCAGMAEGAGADVEMRIDDHVFLARAADGTPVGFIRGNLKHSGGVVTLELGRFRPSK